MSKDVYTVCHLSFFMHIDMFLDKSQSYLFVVFFFKVHIAYELC